MREHGLLLPNYTRSWMGKVSEALCLQNGKPMSAGRFIALMQLTTGIAFDKIVEARQYEQDLKKFIFKWVTTMTYTFTHGLVRFKKKKTKFYKSVNHTQIVRIAYQRPNNISRCPCFSKIARPTNVENAPKANNVVGMETIGPEYQ